MVSLFGNVQGVVRRVLVARGVRSSEVEVQGQVLHQFELAGRGKGPPVVLVHGLGGSAQGFASIFFGLARRFRRILAVDLPGHGFSPDYAHGPVSVPRHCELLEAWCRQVVGEPAFIVGNSLGGGMTLRLAAQQPGLVRALGLLSPAGADVAPELVQEVLQALDVRTRQQAHATFNRLFHQPPRLAPLISWVLLEVYGTRAVRGLSEDVRANRYALSPEALRSLDMPVLLVWGQGERLLPRECLDYFRTHLPVHAVVREVPRIGHLPHMERPSEVVSELIRFADAHGL
jgi:pimeloyl-ACP methyl ester carboxylesterase